MKKIAFYGKGGIGKSTTAANVSAKAPLAATRVVYKSTLLWGAAH